jgi:PPOX class probable F420-dependent enzyme
MDELTSAISAARYVNLASFRRDGREVRTPVWMAASGGRHFVFTSRTVGKVKRLRRDPRLRLAVCDMRGGLQSDWVEGRAAFITDAETLALGYRALRRKYGWQMRLIDLGSWLSGRLKQRELIEIFF